MGCPQSLDMQPHELFQFFEAAAAHLQLLSALQHDRIIATRVADQCLDEIESHDRRAMDAEEFGGIEPLLESLHPLPDQVTLVRYKQLGIRPAGDQIIDLLYRYDTHLAPHLDCNALEILTLWRRL